MGALLQLLRTSALTGFRGGAGKVATSRFAQSEGAAMAEAAEQWAASGAQKAVSAVGEKTGGFFGKAWSWVRGNPVKTTVGVGGGAGANAANNTWQAFKESPVGKVLTNKSVITWALGAAALGGLFLAFKDKIFGKDESPDVSTTPQQPPMPQALSAEEQLLAPQMQAPVTRGSRVTASYPAAVGSVEPQMAQAAPPPANNWQQRVGGPKQPAVMTATPQESYLAAEQARAEAAAAQHNGVA